MPIDRRNFVKTGAGAAIGASLWPGKLMAEDTGETFADEKVKVGILGVGLRGTWHLRLCLQRNDVEVKAVNDIVSEKVERAQAMVEEAGQRKPRGYSEGPEDFLRLVEEEDLDAVIIASPWVWHTPMAVAAMRNGMAAGVEVPAGVTVRDCWDLVDTSEETGMRCMILENVCYRRDVMAVLNMVRQDMFGELIHCRCGYQHDLRAIKFQPGAEFGHLGQDEAVWRTYHSAKRDGDLYPTHGVGPVAKMLNINSGNRFLTLTSMSTKSRGLHNYIVDVGGEDHPNAKIKFALGDVVTTMIKCTGGETIIVTHDTNLPRPYSLNFRVQGTKGLWTVDGGTIYIEGLSPEAHRWEPFADYQERYDHPLWKRYADQATGSGHGGMDFFVVNAFIESVKRGVEPPIDVYDAAAWSVISPLSERSVAEGGEPMSFPDFTRGKWVTRRKIFGLSDEF